MKALRRVYAWSWVVTLPVVLFWLLWAISTAESFQLLGVRHLERNLWDTVHLWDVGRDEFDQLHRRARLAVFPGGTGADDRGNGLRTISLYVPEQNIAQLDSRLPWSGFQYVKGGIWDGERIRKAKVRYRGDLDLHWGYRKKSWRVRTTRDTLFEGMRTFNLIAPKHQKLNNYLAYRLAERLGLYAPRVEMVHLAINGELDGVRLLCEQLSEQTLRRSGLMPGDLYSGDLVVRGSYQSVSNAVFEHPGLWEKRAVNNHYPEEHREPIERLIELANAYPSEDTQAELAELLDLEVWGRFSAFESLAGTYEYLPDHNWRLYYDLNRSKMIPVVWDPQGWFEGRRYLEEDSETLDVIRTRLHSVLFMNGDFLRARHAAIREFFASGEHDAFLEEVDQAVDSMRSALAVDPNLRFAPRLYGLPRMDTESALSELRETIAEGFDVIERAFVAPTGRVRYASVPGEPSIALSVAGRRPVERLIAHFDRPLPPMTTASLRVHRDGRPVDTDVSGALRVDGHRLEVELGLLPRTKRLFTPAAYPVAYQNLLLEEGYYELRLPDLGAGSAPLEVLVDRGLESLEPAEGVDHIPATEIGALYRVTPVRPSYAPLTWRGSVRIEGVREIETDLVIEPGTVVEMAPEASLIVRGRLLAQGTAERPIRFEPLQPDVPWGTVVVQGPKSRGSRLRHCTFVLGSGLKDGLREYSAMLSVNDTGAVRIESCSFRDNRVVDDMVHAVYAEVDFVGCTFEGALSDALDLDICTAAVRGCVFEGSGNDGLDLMTSRVVVSDSLLTNNGDKGISVGEGSRLFAVNNRFAGNLIGIQVKDGSTATVYNADLQGNSVAVDAYKKNWQYGDGGRVRVHKSRIAGNETGVTADKHSQVVVSDSFCDARPPEDGKGRVVFEETVDDIGQDVARSDDAEAVPELGALEIPPAVWMRFDPTARGARLGNG